MWVMRTFSPTVVLCEYNRMADVLVVAFITNILRSYRRYGIRTLVNQCLEQNAIQGC